MIVNTNITVNFTKKRYLSFLTGLFFSLISLNSFAENASVLEAINGKNLAQQSGLDRLDLTAGGWLSAGYTYNPDHPVDRSNGPVQFNNRANEFHLFQLGLYVDKAVDHSADDWQVGGRFEFMFGTDTPNTQATGHWDSQLITPKNLRFYDIALPQAYLEIFAPFGNGISAKIGHFYSILGYESVPSSPNLFVSHSYSMKSSPFTMTGILISYPVNDYLTVQTGAVTGPDNMDKHAGAWSFLGGFNLENKAHSTGFAFSILNGDVDDTLSSHLLYYYSMFHHDFIPALHYILEHDYGNQQNAVGSQRAEWYSVVNYLTYDIDETWNAGLRAEWFHDDDGTRFSLPGSFYELSAGLNWKPAAWLKIRPEIRYDWADGAKPFNTGTSENQLLFSIDSVILF